MSTSTVMSTGTPSGNKLPTVKQSDLTGDCWRLNTNFSLLMGIVQGILAKTNSLTVSAAGYLGIGTQNPTSTLQAVGLVVYANNAAAKKAGLTAGAFYRTGADPDVVCIVH